MLRGTKDYGEKIYLGELRSWGSADVSYLQNMLEAVMADGTEYSSLLQREGHRSL